MQDADKEKIKKHYWLYVLKLEQHKYYVGITAKTPERRYEQHRNGYMAAQWTRKYKPLNLFDKKDLGYVTIADAERYENKVVRTYIAKYGYNNVRGGDLSYNAEFVKRFGWYIVKDDWKNVVGVLFLMLTIILLTIMYYMKK